MSVTLQDEAGSSLRETTEKEVYRTSPLGSPPATNKFSQRVGEMTIMASCRLGWRSCQLGTTSETRCDVLSRVCRGARGRNARHSGQVVPTSCLSI